MTLPSGRRLLAIKITDNINEDEDEPEFLYSSTMHGNETAGYIILMRLIDYLTNGYEVDARITNIVNNTELWICPLVNPDGTYAGGNSTVSGAIRRNSNNVDLNRNFPNPLNGPNPDGNQWQPETIAMMELADDHDFVLSANIHSGAEVFNYPWDTWTSAQNIHADDDWWRYVGNEYADTVQFYGPPGYFTDVHPSGVTEGGDWFVIYGSRQDYMQYYKHCREVTLELSTIFVVPENTLPDYWEYNYRALLNYIEQSLYGLRGIITDGCSGLPMKALVSVDAHDSDSSQVYSSLPIGNYHRPIFEGTYSFTFSAPGYDSQTISNISLVNKESVIQNIELNPSSPISDFTIANTGLDIDLTNISANATTYEWDFGDGNTSTEANPSHSYATDGDYTITLISIGPCERDTTFQNIMIMTTSIDTEFANSAITIFPNPTSGILHVNLNAEYGDITSSVYDITGRLHYNQLLNNERTIDLSSLAQGMYYIKFTSDAQSKTISFVLSR